MAYIINKFNGDQAAVVEDGTINTTLDLKLIGKNYAGYGEAQNENYTWLLENFASQTAPPKAIIGQLWYQTTTQKLKVNYGTGLWHNLGITDVVSSINSASGLTEGDLFWITDQQQLWCKGSNENVLIGGKLTNIATQMKSTTVTTNDSIPVTHEIIEAVINGVTSFVISSHSAMFTLANAEPLKSVGFSNIYPGITIKGFSSTNNDSPDYKFWGSSSDSDRLGGVVASSYVTKSGATFLDVARFSNAGLSIGPADNEILYVLNENSTPTIRNSVSSTIQFKTTESGSLKFPMKLEGQNILPGTPYTSGAGSNIGSLTAKFNTVYANTFNGTATSANGIVLSGSVLSADVDATASTIVARSTTSETIDSHVLPAGSIKAVQIMATGTSTYYADLAEKYLADTTYEVGTVLMIGGEQEVTAATSGFRALGVVSENPGYLMNIGLENGTAVALKGRVPVKVIGEVKKGDRLVASSTPGFAKALDQNDSSEFVFAISLSHNQDDLVEAVIL